MTTTYRYPDSPSAQIARAGLDDLPTSYIAQLKLDGWRTVTTKTAHGLTFTSRHGKPIPISAELAEEVAEMLSAAPVGSVFDGEWNGRRPAARRESLWFFDVMQLGGLGLWAAPFADRLLALRGVVPPAVIVPSSAGDYAEFFDLMTDRTEAEGIVLRRADSRYIGSYRGCASNPAWIKAKWRAGEDGCTKLAALVAGGAA